MNILSTTEIERRIFDLNLPPWRPIPSRMAAGVLGVTLQTLANWRMRDVGPVPVPMLKNGGNRIYYRPDQIWEWVTDGGEPSWKINARWAEATFGLPPFRDEDHFAEFVPLMDADKFYPNPKHLWRRFRR